MIDIGTDLMERWREIVAKRDAEIERLRKLLKMFRDGYDCDADAHQHGTPCRCCLASAALAGSGNELVDI